MSEKIRRYPIEDVPLRKVDMGRYVLFLSAHDCMEHCQAPNGSRFIQRELGLNIRIGVERNGVWAVWTPGWGIDIHWPPDKSPAYADGRVNNEQCQFTGGPCFSDGSSLADGEQAWPRYRHSGVDGIVGLLNEWLDYQLEAQDDEH